MCCRGHGAAREPARAARGHALMWGWPRAEGGCRKAAGPGAAGVATSVSLGKAAEALLRVLILLVI